MNKLLVAFIIGFAAGFALFVVEPSFTGYFTAQEVNVVSVEPLFSPGVEDDFINLIRSARYSIELEVYTFTSLPLIEELGNAVDSGVDVKVILERSIDSNLQTSRELLARGVKVKWGSPQFERTHSKFVVIDSEIVLVGSNNWTFHSLNANREASVKLRSREVARRFTGVFYSDWQNGVEVN